MTIDSQELARLGTIQKTAERAMALAQSGKLQEAEILYRAIVNAGIREPILFYQLAMVCGLQGKNQDMAAFLKQVLSMKPDFPEELCRLGDALAQQGDLEEAIKFYYKALFIKPDFPEALHNLGNALQQKGLLDAAISAYQKVLGIRPDLPETLNSLGNALHKKLDLDAAIIFYRKALAIKSNYPEALSNLGTALQRKNDLEAAIICHKKALAMQPDSSEKLVNLGHALKDRGDLEAAISHYRQAISINNFSCKDNYADARNFLASLLFLSNDYENGWNEYEWRWRFLRKEERSRVLPQIERWNGHNHSPEERLAIVTEGGLGDTLQFMRYIIYLKNANMKVSFYAHTKLHKIIQASHIAETVYIPRDVLSLKKGKWLPLLSLPKYLKVTPANPLITPPYIKAPQDKILKWKQKLTLEERPIIGINWCGNVMSEKSHHGGRTRSLSLQTFSTLIKETEGTFLSLQKDLGSEQLEDFSFPHRFVRCQDEINQTWDFVETAAMIVNCDLVITNDTAVAHLAGGLAQPTWLLLTLGPDWRWGMEDTTFWYPSMRLFRQREWGNWPEVMERVLAALKTIPVQRHTGG